MTKRIRPDESLVDIVGTNELGGEIGGRETPIDPIGALILETQFGIRPKASASADHQPLSLEETKKALTAMSEQLADVRRKTIVEEVFPKLLAESEELYGEDNLTTRFLRAAVTKDKAAMREVIKLMDRPYVPPVEQ
jgi:hypothetical protein